MKVSQSIFLNTCLSMYKAEQIAIFGAGKKGIELLNVFRRCGKEVKYFCDNSKEKQGKEIEGVLCISYSVLTEKKDEVVVFVSPDDAQKIFEQLQADSFPMVVPKAFIEVLFHLPKENVRILPVDHFYSPYPDFQYIETHKEEVFDKKKKVMDIELNEEVQINLLKRMSDLYDSAPDGKQSGEENEKFRYKFGNQSFGTGDAMTLHCMLRILKPKKVIEVGSGYSSAMLLDTNQYYLDGRVQCSFIEPYPQLLKSLCKKTDNICLRENKLQEIELEFFEQLESGDILFIDSTHVSAAGSDVNYVLFEILPRLQKGVYIHFHDIFYPFEYPEKWILKEGKQWTELYLLRAFLQNNKEYSIQFFHNFMEEKYRNLMLEKWRFEEAPYGGSLWLRKNEA